MQYLYDIIVAEKHRLRIAGLTLVSRGYGEFVGFIYTSFNLQDTRIKCSVIQRLSMTPIADELIVFYCEYLNCAKMVRDYQYITDADTRAAYQLLDLSTGI